MVTHYVNLADHEVIESLLLLIPRAGIKGICHNVWLLLYILKNIYLLSAAPSQSPLAEFFPHSLSPSTVRGQPLLHIPNRVHQISTELGISFPTEARNGSPLLHMCVEGGGSRIDRTRKYYPE